MRGDGESIASRKEGRAQGARSLFSSFIYRLSCRLSYSSSLHKGLLAIIHLAKKDAVCFDLGKAGAVQLLVQMWPEWDDDDMRQLLLWAVNEIARIGGCTSRALLWWSLDGFVYGRSVFRMIEKAARWINLVEIQSMYRVVPLLLKTSVSIDRKGLLVWYTESP